MYATGTKTRLWPWLAALAVLTAALSIVLLCKGKEPAVDPARVRTWEAVTPRIEKAELADLEVCNKRIEMINAFFAERKRRSTQFAESVVSLEGKARLLWSKMPWADEKEFENFVRAEFTRLVLNSNDLKTLLEACFAGYEKAAQALENELLCDLRADLGDSELFRAAGGPKLGDEEAFRKEYQRLLAEILPTLNKELAVEVGRQAVNWIGMDLILETALAKAMTAALTRLGVSSGILGAGAASTVASLGLGLLAGYLIDMVVEWLLKEVFKYDPVREIARKVNESLEQMRKSLIDGDTAAGGTYEKLRQLQRSDPFPAVREECGKAANQIGNSGRLGLRLQLTYFHDLRCEARQLALKRLVIGNTPEPINCWPGGAAGRRFNAFIAKGSEP